VNRGVQLLRRNVRFAPIENPSFIGTGCDAIPATDTPVVVHDHDPIRLLPGGMDRTDLHTGGILTLLALDGKIDIPFLRNRVGIVVMFRVFEIDQISSLQLEDPDPMKLTFVAGLIILLDTGIDASPAADASGKLKAVAPEGILLGFLRTDLEFPSIFLLISLLQFGNEAFLFLFGHLQKMFLKEVLDFLFCARGEERDRHSCNGGQGKVTDEFSSCVIFISHFPAPLAAMGEARVLSV